MKNIVNTYMTAQNIAEYTGNKERQQVVAQSKSATKMSIEDKVELSAGLQKFKPAENKYQGMLIQTGYSSEVAIVGQGFFAVQTPQGERYTRNGSFFLTGAGELMTKNEGLVLNSDGGKIIFTDDYRKAKPHNDGKTVVIVCARDCKIEFRSDGKIVVDGDERCSIKIVGFIDENQLINTGNNLFDAGNATENKEINFNIMQGFLEDLSKYENIGKGV